MTRQLAQDALRYVSREYKDDAAQVAKMRRKHGDNWHRASGIAMLVWLAYGDTKCIASLQSMIEDRLRNVEIKK